MLREKKAHCYTYMYIQLASKCLDYKLNLSKYWQQSQNCNKTNNIEIGLHYSSAGFTFGKFHILLLNGTVS